jgi:hypothetical protein
MVKNAEKSLRREQDILYTMNELFIRFRGDQAWVPTGDMHTSYDDLLVSNALSGTAAEKCGIESSAPKHHDPSLNGASGTSSTENLGNRQDDQTNSHGDDGNSNQENEPVENVSKSQIEASTAVNGHNLENKGHQNGLDSNHLSSTGNSNQDYTVEPMAMDLGGEEHINEPEEEVSLHRMTTRAQVLAADQNSRTPSPPPVHPFFNPPPPQLPIDLASHKDDPLGPLLSFVSKQEEVVRLQNELYQGLLKAQRMRKEVYTWCKAEGHVGEMSDGEDWVDLEEWNLQPGELVKGKEEDEAENAITEGAGRRGRRGGRGAGDRGDR